MVVRPYEMIIFGVLFVTNANERALEEFHNRRKYFLMGVKPGFFKSSWIR